MTSPAGDAVARPAARILGALVLDAVLVVVFAAVGRASHGEHVLAGLGETAWPFLAALVVGWVATLAWRAPRAPVRTGLPVWVITVVGGMLLRAVSGQGTQAAFVIVASVVLLLLLVGWRLVVRITQRLRRSGSRPTTDSGA